MLVARKASIVTIALRLMKNEWQPNIADLLLTSRTPLNYFHTFKQFFVKATV